MHRERHEAGLGQDGAKSYAQESSAQTLQASMAPGGGDEPSRQTAANGPDDSGCSGNDVEFGEVHGAWLIKTQL